ncbi:MAG: family 43 glycosylhydrolase [Marinilabiliaceae bacterium]
MMKLFIILVTALVLLFPCEATNDEKQEFYENPVVPGDFPDPTIIRVDDTYYAAGTSSDFGGNYPLYESKDLVNWDQIGYVFNELPAWASDSFWAPELYYQDGTFYVYYAAKRKSDRISCIGVATTTDIHEGFTDRGIVVEWGDEAIDAFVFQDDEGGRYISWKAYGLTEGRPVEILCSELSSDGLELVGEHFSLTDHAKGWEGSGHEGQCIVKKDDYYYMFYSIGGCCDNQCSYRVRVARSKELRSGWEQYPEPILEGGEEWVCPGHGTLVSTSYGRDFYLYHSYHATDFEYVGRQGMLDEVVWDEETGWPRFKNGNTPTVKGVVPFDDTIQKRDTVFYDDFSIAENNHLWQWDITMEKPDFAAKDGNLSLSPGEDGLAFLGRRPKTGDYSLTVDMPVEPSLNKGLCIYGNQQNVLALNATPEGLTLFQIAGGDKNSLAVVDRPEGDGVQLKVEVRNGRFYRFFYSPDNKNWVPVKMGDEYVVDGKFLPSWGAGIRAGVFVDGKTTEKSSFSEVRFDYEY